MFDKIISNMNPMYMIIFGLIMILGIALVIYSSKNSRKLNSIKADKVGDGQHGSDRLMNEKEMRELYNVVILPEKMVDMSDVWKPGRVVHYIPKTREAFIDESMTHSAVEAPTEVGKTSTYMIPNAQYNMMAGTNMIIPCIKPELIELLEEDAKALGYDPSIIDFNDPGRSIGIDFFSDINEKLMEYSKTKDLMSLAEAETLAERLAEEITTVKDVGDEKQTKFFNEASLGLAHASILLTAMFGEDAQKHLSSVRSIIQNIQMMPQDEKAKQKISKIQKLLGDMPDDFGPKKHVGAAFAATHETEDNVYASVLGDLRAINNTQAEQVISVICDKNCFDYRDLVHKKSILFIHMPETKPEFFVFAKLIIQKICNQLSNYAIEKYKGMLPSVIKILWDEWGLSPKITNFHTMMPIYRGKGMLFDLIYQDQAQPKLIYGEDATKIIKNQCAIEIILGIAPTNETRAEELSKVVGKRTIKSGSVSKSRNSGANGGTSSSITEQMIEREILSTGEILRMEQEGKRLLFRRGQYPFLAYFPSYYKEEWGLYPKERIVDEIEVAYFPVQYIDFSDLQEKIEDYKILHGISSKSNIDVTYIPGIDEDTTISKFDQVMNQIASLTNNDVEALSLLDEKKYPDFMKYMSKYKHVITRFELQTLLEQASE